MVFIEAHCFGFKNGNGALKREGDYRHTFKENWKSRKTPGAREGGEASKSLRRATEASEAVHQEN